MYFNQSIIFAASNFGNMANMTLSRGNVYLEHLWQQIRHCICPQYCSTASGHLIYGLYDQKRFRSLSMTQGLLWWISRETRTLSPLCFKERLKTHYKYTNFCERCFPCKCVNFSPTCHKCLR